jgi:glucuronate isomerase
MTQTATAALRNRLLEKIRKDIAASTAPVRDICARHRVPWQSFYAHARREGFPVRRAKRAVSTMALLRQFKAAVQARLSQLSADPDPRHDAARRMLADTLARLIKMEDGEKNRGNRRRRQKRALDLSRRAELSRRLDELAEGYRLEQETKAKRSAEE